MEKYIYTMHRSNSSVPVKEREGLLGKGTPIVVTKEVRAFILTNARDFRICTSCGGPILLPTSIKRPKSSDIRIPVGEFSIYISRFQAPFLTRISEELIPTFLSSFLE